MPATHFTPLAFVAVLALVGSLPLSAAAPPKDAAAPLAKDRDAKVTGTITLNGKPLAAKIVFHFGDEFVGAKIKDDGRYAVSRIAPGAYRVTIEGKFVPEKYSADDKTQLSVEIKEGAHTIDFDLST